MTTIELSPAKKLAREKVRGLWIAIPTPFTKNDIIDEDLLLASVEYYIDRLGVEGIYCGGVMGEFWALTLDERKRVHELVAQQNAGRIPLIAHTGHHVLADVIDLSNHAAEIGIEFAIVMNPYYPVGPPDELVRHWYKSITEATSIPLFLFNTRYSGYNLSPQLISELSDLEAVCGIKNPRPREHLLEVQRLAGDRIVVTDAAEGQWLELHLEHGFQSLMSTLSLALFQTPENRPIADYTALADEGDLESAWEIQKSLAEHREVHKRWVREPSDRGIIPMAHLKYWLEVMGLPQGHVRPPLVPLTPEEKSTLEGDLDQLGLAGTIPSL
jgi:4-hydroxy-tetrahydrodipicolinate synthase